MLAAPAGAALSGVVGLAERLSQRDSRIETITAPAIASGASNVAIILMSAKDEAWGGVSTIL